MPVSRFLNHLQHCFKSNRSTRQTLAPRKNKRWLPLALEALEDRLVPAPLATWPGGHIPIHHPGQVSLVISGVPTQITAGTSFSVSITEYDANTGAAGTYSGSVALTENSGGYYGTSWSLGSATLFGGTGTAVVAPHVAGSVTIIADAGLIGYGNTDVRAESNSLVVNPGPAVGLAVSAPTTAYQGVPFAVSVTAHDAWGNTATSFNHSCVLSASDGQTVTPSTVTMAAGTGSASITLRNADAVNLLASGGGVSGSASLTIVSPITGLSTTVGFAPGYSSQYLQTGSEVDITGQDFQPGAKVIFGNPNTSDPTTLLGLAKTAGIGATPTINSSGTWLSVNVPRYAVNGPIEVIDPDGTCLTSPQTFTVNNYRNTFAFNFHNFTFNITWGMLKNEFGSQVDITIPNPFGSAIDTGVPNPIALGVWGIAAAALNGKGACFGMALTSVLMSEYNTGLINASNGLPSGSAATVFNLQNNNTLTGLIEQNHLAQISQQVITNFLSWEAGAVVGSHSTVSVYNQISSLLSTGHHPIISLESGAAHAVVAYNLEGSPNGVYYIDVYDCNRPFDGLVKDGLDPTENIDLKTHMQIEQASRIKIDPASGWSFMMADGISHSGGFGSLQVVPVSLVSGGVTFPGNFTKILTGGVLSVFFGSKVPLPLNFIAGGGDRLSVWDAAPPSANAAALSVLPLNETSWHAADSGVAAFAHAEHAGPARLGFFEFLSTGKDLLEPLWKTPQ